jgi:hypothetical protein
MSEQRSTWTPWLGDGDPPAGAVVYVWPDMSGALLASYDCPASAAITRLWQRRMLAQLAGMQAGDEGWPGTEARKMRKRGRPR